MTSTILRLDPSLPLATPIGPGEAVLVIDYGPEHHLLWVVGDDATGQLWAWPNPKVRLRRNISMQRLSPEIPVREDPLKG